MDQNTLTPRKMRDIIAGMTEEQLDYPIVMHVDGGKAMAEDAEIGDGVIDLE
jgi:hypothetical protein